MSTENEHTRIPIDFEVASPGDDASVDSGSHEWERDLARSAAAEIRTGPRPMAPPPITEELGEGLTLDDTACLLQWTTEQVQDAIDERQLLAHRAGEDGISLPAFQFTGDPPEISESVRAVLEQLGPVCEDPRTLLAWFCAPKDELAGATPVAWIRDKNTSEMVLLAAKRDAERLS